MKPDLAGRKFGRLTAIERIVNKGWVCRCDCGSTVVRWHNLLVKGLAKSCGCLRNGRSHSAEYRSWTCIKSRCSYPKDKSYHRYGGRGIKVCERWQGKDGFENFLADMGPKPTPKHTIDRIDTNKGYEPSNCRWATNKEQNNNRRNTVVIEHGGKRLTLDGWESETGLSRDCLYQRYRAGRTPETGLFAVARRGWSPCAGR